MTELQGDPAPIQSSALTRMQAKAGPGSISCAPDTQLGLHVTVHYKSHSECHAAGGPSVPGCVPLRERGWHSPQCSYTRRPGTGCQSRLQQQEMQMLFDIPEMNRDPQR